MLLDVLIKDNSLSAYGLISRQLVKADIQPNQGLGIRFIHPCGEIIDACTDNLFSTQRNTVLAKNNNCICLTEHFLAGAALAQVNNLDISLSEEELPFGDGGAKFWFDFLDMKFKKEELKGINFETKLEVRDENDDSRYITLEPANELQISYQLVSQNPGLESQEYIWTKNLSADEVSKARTFSNYTENQMLQLENWVLGFDENGFKQDLFFDNEPARHKVLDLLGDLYLSGFNPLSFNAKITSHKAGHKLNTDMARKIKEYIANNNQVL